MEQFINYSFIIPHKDIPELLQRCLRSIPRREDIQIIVVDDNSDPDKVDFKHFPGVGEPCVEVYFTKEGKGAGYARNVGLKHAKGKWVLFADADDYYVEGFLLVLDRYENSKCDAIYYNASCDVRDVYDRSQYVNYVHEKYKKKHDEKYVRFLAWEPWNKMVLHSFLKDNSIVFEEILVGNDAFFSFNVGVYANKIIVLDEKLYCVTYNPNSISYKKGTLYKEYSRLQINIRINKFLRCHKLSSKQFPVFTIEKLFQLYRNYGIYSIIMFMKIVCKSDSFVYNVYLYFYDRLKYYMLVLIGIK